jgi:hypothetical protein
LELGVAAGGSLWSNKFTASNNELTAQQLYWLRSRNDTAKSIERDWAKSRREKVLKGDIRNAHKWKSIRRRLESVQQLVALGVEKGRTIRSIITLATKRQADAAETKG